MDTFGTITRAWGISPLNWSPVVSGAIVEEASSFSVGGNICTQNDTCHLQINDCISQ